MFIISYRYFRSTGYRKLLSDYTASGLLNYTTLITDLNTATTGKPAAVVSAVYCHLDVLFNMFSVHCKYGNERGI